ncbi:MAG TPA: AI-2E family transporter [Bryobacteraceae bacterium]|jgi:predicted PurR-regulated permease PerM|nr:AI-2E family transporter [Bryobacteraceae bacterium]
MIAETGPATRPKLRSEVGAIVLLGTIAVLYFAREIFVPFAFALILTFLLTPVVAFLQRLRIGRVVSVLLTVLVTFAVAGGIGWVIMNQLVDVVTDLPLYRENIRAKIEALHTPVKGQLGQAAESVKEIVREVTGPEATSPAAPPPRRNLKQLGGSPAPASPVAVRMVEAPTSGWAQLRDLGMPVLVPLGLAGVVVIFTVFMLLKREDLRNRLLRLVGLGQLKVMTQALDDAATRVSRYMLLQFLVNAGFGALFGFSLYLIGVPNPLLWGALAGILRIVPYVGTLAAATLPIGLSLAVFDGWLKPLLVFLLVAGLELIIGNVVEPWLYGAHVGISSLALLVTAVFWTVLWGPAGLILSTPLTVCVVVLGRYVPHLSFLHILLGDEPVLGPEAQIYQRLLAMDQQEAHTIVDQFMKGRPLIELYDSVLIPALSMAEQDRHKGAIDAAREDFLFLSINEMIAEFSEYQPAADISSEEDAPTLEDAQQFSGRVVCLSAHDQADEITAAMLAQLLQQKGFAVLSFSSTGESPNDWLKAIDAKPGDVVCISALPPYAFAPARVMCKQIRERFPKLKVVVCVWGFSGDTHKAKARFERTQPHRLSTSLAEALGHVQELVGPKPEATTLIA